MTVNIYRQGEITRPEPPRVTSSVLDHATVVETDKFGMRNNEGLWPSYNCMDTLNPTALCPDPALDADPKTFAFGEWVTGFEFAVYGAVQCGAVGLDVADMESEVKRVFERNEGRGVETSLAANRFVEDADPGRADDPWWGDPRDVTEGLTVAPHIALALLEGDAALHYAGLPTIHMPRAMATVLSASGLIVWKGDEAFTKNGSKVAMGGGYDLDLDTGLWTMYATGEVYIERSEQVSVSAWTQPGDGSHDRGLADNRRVALVERLYRVGIDCYITKATGKAF